MRIRPVFVDAAAWIGIANVRDGLHAQARRVYAELVQARTPLITTEFVLMELADALAEPPVRTRTIAFIEQLRQGVIEIVPISPELLAAGWDFYTQRPDKGWGWTDCTSFALMHRLGIQDAFTSDHHFTQAGFTRLL